MPELPKPPHDCRVTARCLRETLGFTWPLDRSFEELRNENSLVGELFDSREMDERGGEGGERIRQIKRHPAFKLTMGRMRGATWFEKNRPPQGIVWLLGAEKHDERHKGRSDAYDILGRLDEENRLFPRAADYKRLELDRRRRDTEEIAADVRRDAVNLVDTALLAGTAGKVAEVPVRIVVSQEEALTVVYVAVSEKPVLGRHSGCEFRLTEKRFLGIQAGIRQAFEDRYGPPVLCDDLRDRGAFPGGLRHERPFVVMLEKS